MTTPRDLHTLPPIEKLLGVELRMLKAELGQPFLTSIETDFENALYAYVWVSEKRHDPSVKMDEILTLEFGVVMEAFKEVNQDVDPTTGGSGSD